MVEKTESNSSLAAAVMVTIYAGYFYSFIPAGIINR